MSISLLAQVEKASATEDEELDQECMELRNEIMQKWPYYFTSSDSSDPSDGNGYLDRKIESIPDGKHFIFITDTHWKDNPSKRSTIIASYVSKRLGRCTVLFGGDAVNNAANKNLATQELQTYADGFFNAFGSHALWACGNHDANLAAVNSGRVSYTEGLIDDPDVYDCTIAKIAHLVSFDQDAIDALHKLDYIDKEQTKPITDESRARGEAWLRLHYHYDDPSAKIRYIVFETGNGGRALRELVQRITSYIIPLQFRWFAKVLLSTPADYDIIVLGHEWTDKDADSDALNMMKMVYSFMEKSSVKINMRSQNTTKGTTFARALCGTTAVRTFNFTTSNHKGRVIVLGGHFHKDAIFAMTGDEKLNIIDPISNGGADFEEDAVLSVITNTDNATRDVINKGVRPTKTGTTDEVCFDVMTLTDDGQLVMTRIGYGEDREVHIPTFGGTNIPTITPQFTIDNAQLRDYFTLDGFKLNEKPSKKGVYVVKGKKMVVK